MTKIENLLLTFLGTDTGFGNNNNSAYIENDNTFTLIDCGFSVFNQIKNKFQFDKYKTINVIITHLHNDHAGSLSQFIMYMWFKYNKKVTVYSKCQNINEYLLITGTPKESYSILSDSANIEFIKTLHVKELDSYGFKLKYNNKTILYTGDTCTLTPYLKNLDNVCELYIDISKNGGVHLKIDEIIDELRLIQQRGISVIPMHMDDATYIKNMLFN